MATPTAQVLKAGMTAEALCYSVPFNVIPMVVTEVQSVIATGQFQSTDRLVDLAAAPPPGSVLTFLERMYEGGLTTLRRGQAAS